MKTIVAIISLVVFFGYASAEERPAAQFSFKATDDYGEPVVGATIGISTFHHWQPGEGFGKDISETFTGVTDENGMVTILGQSLRGDFSYGPRDLSGFYRGGGGEFVFKEKEGGKWQPWNPLIEINMKRIINPIPMYGKKVGELPNALEIPVLGEPVGFDLMKGEWVAPYGGGIVSDLIFKLTEQVPFRSTDQPFSLTLTVTFSNPQDGIQSVLVPLNTGSALRLPRFAPEDGYQPEMIKKMGRPAVGERIDPGTREDQNYFFRVRTVVDEDGKIVSAHYGKVFGDIACDVINSKTALLQFTYCLNPNPNDRNMEFDPKRNLFGPLPFNQRVTTP
jgi:hypothetical protein